MLVSSSRKTPVTGTTGGAVYTIYGATFFGIDLGLYDSQQRLVHNKLYRLLLSRSSRPAAYTPNKQNAAVVRLIVFTSIHHGLCALVSRPRVVPAIIATHGELLTYLEGIFDAGLDLGESVPPNQLEHHDSAMAEHHFVHLNPLQGTVRRTLAYINYVSDSNTSIDAPGGSGIKVGADWSANWAVAGDVRRKWLWPRRLQGALSATNVAKCTNIQGGNALMTQTWSGIEGFSKNHASMAWMPNELFAWPCSALYRFYSVAGAVDNVTDCSSRQLGFGPLMPLVLTHPTSASGYDSISVANLAVWSYSNAYMSIYARPYADDSDGSGVLHRMT